MWEIYSIGDSAYLAAILNAVAMIAGTNDFRTLAGIGFLIGVLLVLFQGILQGGRGIRFQNLLLAWVVYALMFGPKVSVAIEDAYSGAVRVVDNVPIGPATVGSVMSNVGYGVTRLFETAFATPAMTDYGFADALQTLMGVRKGTLSRLALGDANSPTANADVERSFVNYVADCTLADVDTGRRAIDDILKDASWETLRSDSDVYTTELWIGGDPRILPCNEAWVALSDYTTVEFVPALLETLQAQLRLSAPGEVANKVQSALDEIAGAGVDAQSYLVMAAVMPFVEKGIVQTHEDLGQWGLAAMVEQAHQQRNTQWAAEQTLFTRIVRPMMTFFEGFLYAIAPLMAFAVALGPVGIAMVGKYLLFGLWIQLWLPIMAVINLYLHLAIARDLAALQGAGHLDVPSMFSLYKLDFLLQDYLATGGMLAASTPAISLMLIYGSAITATHLAGRLQGGDFVDEKVVSPDVVRPAPALALSPLQTNAPLTGTVTSGAESVLPRFNVGQELQSSVTATSAALAQSSAAFQRGLSNTAAASASRSGETFDSRAIAWNYEASGSQTDRALLSEGESLARKYSQSGITSEQMAGLITSGLNAGGGGGSRTEIRGGISGQLQTQYGVDQRLGDEIADDIARRVTSDHELSARLAEGVKADLGSGSRNVFTDGLRSEELSTLSQQAGDTISASRSQQRAESLARRYGTAGSFGAVEVGHALARNPGLMEQLDATIMRMGLVGDHQRLASEWRYAETFSDREQARAAAGLGLLLGYEQPTYRSMEDPERLAAREEGLRILSAAFGGGAATGIDPHRHADLEGQAPAHGATRGAVDRAGLRDPRPETDGLRRDIDAHRQVSRERYDPIEVDRAHGRQRGRVDAFSAGTNEELRADKRDLYAARIEQRAVLPRPSAQALAQELGGLATQVSQAPGMVMSGAAGALVRFAGSLSSTGSLPKAVMAAGDGWTQARAAFIDTRMDQVQGIGLTPAQMAVYRGALDQVLPGATGLQAALGTELANAREALIREEGTVGAHMADLLTRSVTARDDSDLRLIAAFNRANRGGTPLSPPLRHTSVTGGSHGAVLDLIASAESAGNYNAWYGDADQSRVNLTGLTLDAVRGLQHDLVRTNGGSAIGRYQIIDDTLENLIGSMGLAGSERFSPQLQDRMALQLAAEAGLQDWLNGRLDHGRFAENLSKVWAGMPRDASNASFYEGVAGNRAQIDYRDVVASLRRIRSTFSL